MPDEKLPAASFWRQKWFYSILLFLVCCCAAAQLLGSVIGNRGQNIFWQEFLLGDVPFAWLWPVFWALAVPLERTLARWNLRAWANWAEINLATVCALSLAGGVFLTFFSAFGHPYTPDELSALLQARTFAAFQITPQVPADLVELIVPRELQGDIISLSRQSGHYSPNYWPGFALLMTPFAFFHLEWLCNPLLTAISLWLFYLITHRLTKNSEAAIWAVVFALCSSQFALGAATFFSMPAHLLANLCFCWLLIQNTRRSAFGAGLVGGFALILHNPVPHFSFVLPWMIWMLRHRRNDLLPLLAGYCVLFLPIGIGWSAHFESFDAGRYVSAAATPKAATPFAEVVSRIAFVVRPPDSYLLLSRLAAFIKLVVWACPGLIALGFLGWREANRDRGESGDQTDKSAHYLWLFGASVVSNFVIYLFINFDQGHGWGFRYMHQSYAAFPILAAFWIVRFRSAQFSTSSLRRFAAALCLLGLLVLPLRALQARLFMQTIWENKPPAAPSGASITFIRERKDAATFIQNDPFLRNEDWKLRFVSNAQNEAVARRHLAGARRVQSGKWGEIWSGSDFTLRDAR
jgi:hypothetical protein